MQVWRGQSQAMCCRSCASCVPSRRLKAVRPDVLLEFRQPYAGPVTAAYGNMLRANACPGDARGVRDVAVAPYSAVTLPPAINEDALLKETKEKRR